MIITGYGNYIGLGLLPQISISPTVFGPKAVSAPVLPSVIKMSSAAMQMAQPYIGPMTPAQFSPQVVSYLQQSAPPATPTSAPTPAYFAPRTGLAVIPSMYGPQPYTTLFSPQYMFQTPVPGAGCPAGSVPGKYPDTCIPVGNTRTMVPQGQTLVKTQVNVSSPPTPKAAAEKAKVDYEALLKANGVVTATGVDAPGGVAATNNKLGLVVAAGAALLLLGMLK